jgi:putative tryptophan/tyrosine transport system substrate-binding protein
MRRREFIALLGSAAVTQPLAVRAQQPAVPVVGFLRDTLPDSELVAALREGLNDAGYREDHNVTLDYRWAEGQGVGLSALAVALVRRPVAVIVAGGGNAIRAAKLSTASIPVVFASGEDPVKAGFVENLKRPDGNLTGASFYSGSAVTAKQLQLIDELVPNASAFALLVNPNNPIAELTVRETRTAAHSLGVKLHVLNASSDRDFEPAFASVDQMHIDAIVVAGDALFTSRRALLVALAAGHAIPAIYNQPEYARAGGLISYGNSVVTAYRQAGIYAGRILKGEKPADLPVQQSTKIELVINLKTAETLGLQVPDKPLALADEVIK